MKLLNRPVYWECKDNGHSKFWAAQIIEKEQIYSDGARVVRGYVLVRKWGTINTKGQIMEQEFNNIYEAERTLDTLIREKENKGYKAIF
jgi:predicted DNA-binding WGR domain protein